MVAASSLSRRCAHNQTTQRPLGCMKRLQCVLHHSRRPYLYYCCMYNTACRPGQTSLLPSAVVSGTFCVPRIDSTQPSPHQGSCRSTLPPIFIPTTAVVPPLFRFYLQHLFTDSHASLHRSPVLQVLHCCCINLLPYILVTCKCTISVSIYYAPHP